VEDGERIRGASRDRRGADRSRERAGTVPRSSRCFRSRPGEHFSIAERKNPNAEVRSFAAKLGERGRGWNRSRIETAAAHDRGGRWAGEEGTRRFPPFSNELAGTEVRRKRARISAVVTSFFQSRGGRASGLQGRADLGRTRRLTSRDQQDNGTRSSKNGRRTSAYSQHFEGTGPSIRGQPRVSTSVGHPPHGS